MSTYEGKLAQAQAATAGLHSLATQEGAPPEVAAALGHAERSIRFAVALAAAAIQQPLAEQQLQGV